MITVKVNGWCWVKVLLVLFTIHYPLFTASAQDNERIASSSIYLQPAQASHVVVPFSVVGEGQRFTPIWGLDQAWISEQNMRKGINHMGKENISIARSCFRTTKPLVGDTALAADPINKLRERNKWFDLHSDTLPLVLTSDQEAGVDEYYRTNGKANVERWSAMINAHVKWLQENSKHPVVGVSPFNEPDYWQEEGATATNSRDIAKRLKEEYASRFNDIAIVGGNTLNDDKASEWFTPGKDYYDWGNTHQLAGSMNNYKLFHQMLAKQKKVGYNDEMHNVAEAMTGLENGMTVGIWWGFDSRARGEFCDISRNGVRLAYGEHTTNWTSASVYRHDDGRVKAFVGSSERQAVTTSYQFVSTDRDVYFDGQGPTRELRMVMHGGTGYQQGQKNAERVIDVTWGDDVQPSAIDGTYKIMNKASTYVVAENGSADGHTNISQTKYTGLKTQQWVVSPVGNTVNGDYSFYDIRSVNDQKHLDVLNYSTKDGGNIIAYPNTVASDNQQWYLQYAGDGYYYIRNRESALYLSLAGDTNVGNSVNICQRNKMENPDRQLWRILPLDAECEQDAPAAPKGLTATPQVASVLLQWDANQEQDLAGYMLLRAEQGSNEWNTIARKLTTTSYIDNNLRQGHQYVYRLKAIDRSDNQSQPSEAVEAAPTSERALIARYVMEDNLYDATANQLDAALYGQKSFTSTAEQGEKALLLGGSQYLQLPYEIASTEELTFAAWINWRKTTPINQRIFDFGNGTRQYMYLTPSNGSKMSYVVNDGTGEKTLDCKGPLGNSEWHHVAVTIGGGQTVIYLDGEEAASTTALTVTPGKLHPTLNYLGRAQNGSVAFLNAYIDDVRLYNYALSADAIQELFKSSPSGIEQLEADDQCADGSAETYYTLSGQQIAKPKSGVYIVRQGQKSRKVFIGR